MNSVRVASINAALESVRIAEQNLHHAQKDLFELLHALNSNIEPSNSESEQCLSKSSDTEKGTQTVYSREVSLQCELLTEQEYENMALEFISIHDEQPKRSVPIIYESDIEIIAEVDKVPNVDILIPPNPVDNKPTKWIKQINKAATIKQYDDGTKPFNIIEPNGTETSRLQRISTKQGNVSQMKNMDSAEATTSTAVAGARYARGPLHAKPHRDTYTQHVTKSGNADNAANSRDPRTRVTAGVVPAEPHMNITAPRALRASKADDAVNTNTCKQDTTQPAQEPPRGAVDVKRVSHFASVTTASVTCPNSTEGAHSDTEPNEITFDSALQTPGRITFGTNVEPHEEVKEQFHNQEIYKAPKKEDRPDPGTKSGETPKRRTEEPQGKKSSKKLKGSSEEREKTRARVNKCRTLKRTKAENPVCAECGDEEYESGGVWQTCHQCKKNWANHPCIKKMPYVCKFCVRRDAAKFV